MDIEKYRALLCAVDNGSLSAAAEQLGYTPSGLSRMMLSLEKEHGFPLLLRGKDGVCPTAECRRILPQIRELIYQGEKLRQLSESIRGLESGSLTIGTAYSAFYPWLSRVTEAFHRQHPGIDIRIVHGYSSDLAAQLAEHRLDVAFISRREGRHDWLPLLEDPLVAMLPGDHALAAAKAVPVGCFAAEAYINTYPGKDIDNARVFARCGIAPNTQYSTTDIHATCAMVASGLGISMNNRINCQGNMTGIAIRPLDPGQTVTIGMAITPDETPALRAFRSFAGSYLREITDREGALC